MFAARHFPLTITNCYGTTYCSKNIQSRRGGAAILPAISCSEPWQPIRFCTPTNPQTLKDLKGDILYFLPSVRGVLASHMTCSIATNGGTPLTKRDETYKRNAPSVTDETQTTHCVSQTHTCT